MDFHSLSRRELQALCKRNKIPANVTNVVMADSLKALEIVEGIDEVLQTCKSEICQSSIKPRVRLEVTSPYVPPTGGRSTSRRNATEKMDSVMKKCSQDEKKDVLLTPAPTGVASRRRIAAKEDSAVKQIYGTRRSARLVEKSARLLKGVGNDTDFSKKDLFTGDAQECKMNLNESLNSLDEMSGVTSVDENSERKDEQVDSAEKQDVSTNAEPVLTIEGEMGNHSVTDRLGVESVRLLNEVGIENPDVLKKDLVTNDCQEFLKESQDGLEGVIDLDEDSGKKGEAQVDSAEEQNVLIENDGAKFKLKEERVDGSQSFVFAGVDANTMVEVNSEQKDEPEFEEKELVPTVDEEYHSNIDDVKTELNENSGAEIEQAGFDSEIDVEFRNQNCAESDKVIEKIANDNTHEDAGSVDESFTENEDDFANPDDSVSIILELTEGSTKSDDSLTCMPSETSLMSYEDDFANPDDSDSIILELTEGSTKSDDSLTCMPSETSSMSYEDDAINWDVAIEVDDNGVAKQDVAVKEETETVQPATDVTTTFDHVLADAPLSEEAVVDDPLPISLKNSSTNQPAAVAPKKNEAFPHIFTGSDDPSLIIQPTLSTPKRASTSKAYARRTRITAASNNKENVGSGSRTAPTKERIKMVKECAELSKNLKELNITPKLDKNEGENEVSARAALQALPENQKAE